MLTDDSVAPKSAPKSSKRKPPPPASVKAQIVLVNGRLPLPEPFPFQARAARSTKRLIGQGIDTVVVSPTGSGKTNIAGYTVADIPNDELLAISHSHPLCDQLEKRLCPSNTVQAVLSGWRPKKKPRLLIWDECHHSAAEMWREARDVFKSIPVLGLTPCPQRADGRALDCFQEMIVAAHYSELMQDGIIVPCKVSGPEYVTNDKLPDPVKAYISGGENKKALFFLPDIETANEVTKRLKRQQYEVGSYHSEMTTKQRDDMLEQFRTGAITVICAVDALSEGIDVPDAEVAVLMQHCAGIAQYLNAVGRVLRRSEGKKFAHLIDLRGASLRHGHPCADRDYSLYGAGMRPKNDDRNFTREYSEPGNVPLYDAKLVQWYDWRWPTVDDKRRQLGWLKRQAATQGLSEEFAERAMKMLFDNEREAAK